MERALRRRAMSRAFQTRCPLESFGGGESLLDRRAPNIRQTVIPSFRANWVVLTDMKTHTQRMFRAWA